MMTQLGKKTDLFYNRWPQVKVGRHCLDLNVKNVVGEKKSDFHTIADRMLRYLWLHKEAHIIISMLAHTCVVAQSVDTQRVRWTQSILGRGTQIWN